MNGGLRPIGEQGTRRYANERWEGLRGPGGGARERGRGAGGVGVRRDGCIGIYRDISGYTDRNPSGYARNRPLGPPVPTETLPGGPALVKLQRWAGLCEMSPSGDANSPVYSPPGLRHPPGGAGMIPPSLGVRIPPCIPCRGCSPGRRRNDPTIPCLRTPRCIPR